MRHRTLAACATALFAPLSLARSQATSAPPVDTVRLGTLHASAVRRDPRARALELLAAQSRLRHLDLDAEGRPTLTIESMAQYQSDVPRIPIVIPGGPAVPTPPHDTYDARLAAQHKLYDPTRSSRRAVEDAQSAEAQSRLRVALHGVRQHVSDAYFAALRAQSQIAELETTITDLDAQGMVAAARVREGVALPSEALAIRAELLRRRQGVSELSASRRAALDVLADLTNTSLDSAATLGAVDLGAEVARARASLTELRARAEFEQFARGRDLLERQSEARTAQDRPRVSAYARAGYGRPGLNPLNDTFDAYWLAGMQLQWSPWNWGATTRGREVLALQRQILLSEERAFTDGLRRGVTQDLATIDRLAATLASDDEIVALRERIATETRVRFGEGVVTAAEYVDRQTDVLGARVSRALHRVELAQARARFLTTLGLEVR